MRTLVEDWRPAGRHDVVWSGENDQGNPVASGVYSYRFRVNQFVATRRMVLLK